jgi:alanyl-tRNA synthetase
MKSQDIRAEFLNFFKEKNHRIVPSSPMVIKDDPTLMFTNAGMNPFKPYFLGNTHPNDQRVADTQKCLRVSGKHNDLEEVGKDTYHHTMFEMLGNWSFGIPKNDTEGYFKKEAISWAWELLTGVFKIDPSWLYVTVFEGSKDTDQLEMDAEALSLWKKIVPESQILFGNKKDNFWEMGDQGPCGPCSEIHIDIRSVAEKEKISGASLVNMDHPHVVEIWNLVFMQFNRKANGILEPLPAKHVDTGMGFERLCMVLQGVKSNYDTDVFTPVIKEIEIISGATYGHTETTDIAFRVIADHIRAVAFSIADGQLPNNNGAGYVIRRILRRAIRYGFTFLDSKEPFMFKLVNVLSRTMGDSFPELVLQKQLIENVIKEEEQSFLRTLDQGLLLLDSLILTAHNKVLSGEKAFELYDTYGFPIDLTALILSERGYTLDQTGFEKSMQAQKQRSRAASEVAKEDWVVLLEDDTQEFIGYDLLETQVKIAKYRKVVSKKEGEMYQLVFNLTPFYPEGGGQVGDKGYLSAPNGDITYIIDTKRENNEIIHFSSTLPKDSSHSFKASVDQRQRDRTSKNHTATHLLHQALRAILGIHVEQKGSAVHSKYLRFDFSHFSKVTEQQLSEITHYVNARIEAHIPLEENRNVPIAEAQASGAMALFGEKYGDTVRSIRFGKSIELCGGTHVKNTADIWQFKIKSETAVASGIRRIEAITADAVKDYYQHTDQTLQQILAQLQIHTDPLAAITKLQEEHQQLKAAFAILQREKAGDIGKELKAAFLEVNGVRFLAAEVALDAAAMKDLSFELGANSENTFLLLGSTHEDKALLSCYISKELVALKSLNASLVVRELGKYIQGGGGGQDFFATAGGKNTAGILEAIAHAKDYVSA